MTFARELAPEIRQMAEWNAAKRIDVLGWCAGVASIIELRDNAGFSAIGQLLGYRHLFTKDFPDLTQVKMILVTNRQDRDILETAETVDIDVEYV